MTAGGSGGSNGNNGTEYGSVGAGSGAGGVGLSASNVTGLNGGLYGGGASGGSNGGAIADIGGGGGAQGLIVINYTPVPAPTVTAVSPNSGPAAGGTSVAITGTTFTGATAVKFGATNAASFLVNSPTSITATSPAHALGAVDITVTTPPGTSATSGADVFTFIALDILSNIVAKHMPPKHSLPLLLRQGMAADVPISAPPTIDGGSTQTIYRLRSGGWDW
ncbi:MAG: IPT/TIG domain-containing protein [Acidobacteria bacterium Pan2503]|uniref:IPT/TIG domain-containing protein n=1 Tax=Candidatus Acidiferrum panamense TaxID=2741543 RepID=A0A7V8NMC3_9BACT|nr:IPT/TIG domain-containing protein [Candidatus Acidoferrum panamensis]